ncbi:hypothetical protein Metev_2368 (plasmid) [Methanohalobium evestigatum Z-7303]|uniref:Uncharacterized protein n=1 Tax=Methanohalobium evestigatum (strain ATCC BAA-1072 / DSM 3721 / NBRC 107634 / OCM 161 / Z-7303) TaxID=644295 RepID=D7EC56_METEZ|nr:rod-determining factor RdfA [Methanohalobium evestigatum]ADI75178.1 hypothetical protein Metev_2368 [Methanohalobium evestigatum Z-7303]
MLEDYDIPHENDYVTESEDNLALGISNNVNIQTDKQEPIISSCRVCNLLKTDLFNEKQINDWFKEVYSDPENQPSIRMLVDEFNNKILTNLFQEKYPEEDLVFDIDKFRKYIEVYSINTLETIDRETWDIGDAIARKHNIDVLEFSTAFINKYDIKKHLQCLGFNLNDDNKYQKYVNDLKKGFDFSQNVANKALERALNRKLVSGNFKAETIIICEDCGKELRVSDLLKNGHNCSNQR